MELRFTKMHGCGNDYIYFSTFDQEIPNPNELAVALSDRHFGIGGDGIVLIRPSKIADARMSMFNADGSEGKMCGNAIRCVGKYLYDRGIVQKEVLTIETLSGIKTLTLFFHEQNGHKTVQSVQVDMGKAELTPANIPCTLPGTRAIRIPTTIAGGSYTINAVSMGNPHCVLFQTAGQNFGNQFDLKSFPIEQYGPKFEKDPLFPEQVNTEFVVINEDSSLSMRVWERGSGETWACGTGACAVVVAAVENHYFKKGQDVMVHLRGGDLVINYTDERVLMTGPATIVFDGVVSV